LPAATADNSGRRGMARLARTLQTRWWPRFLLAGVLPVVIGATLLSGVAGAWVVGAGAVIICIFVIWLLSINPYRELSGSREGQGPNRVSNGPTASGRWRIWTDVMG